MADEAKTEEVVEETQTESTEESTEKTEESTEESPKETEADVAELQAHKDFDKLIDDDEAEEAEAEQVEEKTEEKTEEKAADEEAPAEEDKVEADDKTSGKTEEAAKTEDVPDDSLLERAVVAGITLGDARGTKSATLERIVAAMEKKSEKPEEEVKVEPFDCKLDPDEYSKEVIGLHNKLGQQALDTKIAMEKMAKDHKEAMEGVTSKVTATDADQARRNMNAQMDGYFNGMEGFDKVFGKGSISTMDKGTPEFEKRMDVEDMMLVLLRGHKQSDSDMPSDDVLFKQAVGIVCPEEISKVALATKVTKVGNQRKQVIGSGGRSDDNATTKEEKVEKIQTDFDAKIDADD